MFNLLRILNFVLSIVKNVLKRLSQNTYNLYGKSKHSLIALELAIFYLFLW